jgi:DNA-binding XRE family transcriptional regulator
MSKPTEPPFTEWTPHAVVERIFLGKMSPTRAWREYLNLTQQTMAERLDISLASYVEQEARDQLDQPTRVKIAAALGVAPDLLDI